MNWRQYLLALLTLICWDWHPVCRYSGRSGCPNPQRLPGCPDLALNTAVSFVTNTNSAAYSGESTLSYFSQMAALTVRKISRRRRPGLRWFLRLSAPLRARMYAHRWVMPAGSGYALRYGILFPVALLIALFYPTGRTAKPVGQPITTLEGAKQILLPMGPVASQSSDQNAWH